MSNYYLSLDGRLYTEDELCHYGVPGMKWGVRKSEYKAMNRKQRKALQKEYFDTEEGKRDLKRITRNTTIGTLVGGPIGGLIGGFSTLSNIAKSVPAKVDSKTVSKGQKAVEDATKKAGDTKVTNLSKAVKSRKPYFALSEQERRSIDRSYEDRRKSLRSKWESASSPEQKQKILNQIDKLELDYLYVVERD